MGRIIRNEQISNGIKFDIIYDSAEYSIRSEPRPMMGFTSLLVNDLNIELNEAGQFVYIWGLCPLHSAIPKDISFPEPQKKNLFYVADKPLISGVSERINPGNRWPIYFDKNNSLVCFSELRGNAEAIEFASGCVAFLENDQLLGLCFKLSRNS